MQERSTHEAAVADLSGRELEVLTMIVNGSTNEEIASELYISVNTLKTHIRHLYGTLGVTTRVQAVIWGVRHGLLSDPPSRP